MLILLLVEFTRHTRKVVDSKCKSTLGINPPYNVQPYIRYNIRKSNVNVGSNGQIWLKLLGNFEKAIVERI